MRVQIDHRLIAVNLVGYPETIWQWVIWVDSWAVNVGSTEGLMCWFSECAIGEHA